MADPKHKSSDEAENGGGIGDIGRRPIDPASENPGNGSPSAPGAGGTAGTGLSVDKDAAPSGEDPDAEADETLGTVV